MDAGGQPEEVVVARGGQDATVVRALPVQALEMTPVVRQHGSAQRMSAGKDVGIRSCCPSILLGCHHVMAQPAKFLDDGEGKVFIGVEQLPPLLHKSLVAFLVCTDGLVDFLCMSGGVLPGGLQIGWG
jgi:hypothetical protein